MRWGELRPSSVVRKIALEAGFRSFFATVACGCAVEARDGLYTRGRWLVMMEGSQDVRLDEDSIRDSQ